MPPELFRNEPFSKAVDVYMFGMVLWEMFARCMPFQGYEIYDIRTAVLKGDRPVIPTIDCPLEIQDLIENCWQDDATKRPSMSTVYTSVKNIQQNVPMLSEIESANADFGDALDSLLQ